MDVAVSKWEFVKIGSRFYVIGEFYVPFDFLIVSNLLWEQITLITDCFLNAGKIDIQLNARILANSSEFWCITHLWNHYPSLSWIISVILEGSPHCPQTSTFLVCITIDCPVFNLSINGIIWGLACLSYIKCLRVWLLVSVCYPLFIGE